MVAVPSRVAAHFAASPKAENAVERMNLGARGCDVRQIDAVPFPNAAAPTSRQNEHCRNSRPQLQGRLFRAPFDQTFFRSPASTKPGRDPSDRASRVAPEAADPETATSVVAPAPPRMSRTRVRVVRGCI
jgi:hypothetical protein